jgi:hypothetical protein
MIAMRNTVVVGGEDWGSDVAVPFPEGNKVGVRAGKRSLAHEPAWESE